MNMRKALKSFKDAARKSWRISQGLSPVEDLDPRLLPHYVSAPPRISPAKRFEITLVFSEK